MDVIRSLNGLGFRDDPVRRFQFAYCGPPVGANKEGWLATDGIAGPKTADALQWTTNNGGRLSTHFACSELACKHCGAPYVRRELLSALEDQRGAYNRPIYIVDGYRCPIHNAQVGGSASDSMHMWGAAVDIDCGRSPITVGAVLTRKRFSGIGSRGALASHLDVRHLIPEHNQTPWATPANPSRWSY